MSKLFYKKQDIKKFRSETKENLVIRNEYYTVCIFIIFIFASFFTGVWYSNNQKINYSEKNFEEKPFFLKSECKSNTLKPSINTDIRNTRDIFNDPYIPPVKSINYSYKQMGILTSNDLILPLLGKPHINGRDKWNYYTISNTGSLNTKLPIRVRGKTCTNEYGCDEIFTGDAIYVEGYNRQFIATVYENNTYNYDPFI